MHRVLLALALAAGLTGAISAQQGSHAWLEANVDAIFARWTSETPGCAVGVSKDGTPLVQKAYGMADLEHDVPNRADTIFEAGSVSKQFTAAAVLLLAQDGKLSLDDPVRRHVPELPDYGAPLTIRHMLQHTSGLRDWGELAAIAGWPRTTQRYTDEHVLDILSRQRALNFTPGTQHSYSNSGYTLAAIIVSRVSGKSLAEFSRERIFAPLGMTRTSWRDDHTRTVKGRAIAYRPAPSGFKIHMPFENVYGNEGLLTTVEDLLKWNENFVAPKVGTPAFLAIQQEPGRLNDGRRFTYAMGLVLDHYLGSPRVTHNGSTAGYRAHLARFPAQGLSVAVLCNVVHAAADQYANAIAKMFMGPVRLSDVRASSATAARTSRSDPSYTPARADLEAFQGRYQSDEADVVYDIGLVGRDLLVHRGTLFHTVLQPTAADTFRVAETTWVFLRDERGAVTGISLRGPRVFDLRFKRVK